MFYIDSSSGQTPSLNPHSVSQDGSSREARVQRTFGQINFYSRKTSGACIEDLMDDMSHTILYQSPLVDDPRKAPFVIIGEYHDSDSRIVNAPAVDELVEPDSILSVEGVSASTMEDNEPLTGIVRSKILSLYRISEYAESCLAVFGWDASNHIKEEIEEDEEGKRRRNCSSE